MNDEDDRRKLDPKDYSRIRFLLADSSEGNYTIREVASMFSVSTKYVKRIREGHFSYSADGSATFTTAPDSSTIAPTIQHYFCSGCGFSYGSHSGLSVHYAIWTSGNTKPLDCMNVLVTK